MRPPVAIHPARAGELLRRVVAPLVLGGELSPVRPFGPRLALALGGAGAALADEELGRRVDDARARAARALVPVDRVPAITREEWALAAALNDLLVVTHEGLSSVWTRGRHRLLFGEVLALLARIPPPRRVGEALARHATFGRALELFRTDTAVTSWASRATFRGERPPARLLAWPSVRRVDVEARRVPLAAFAARGVHGVSSDDHLAALSRWLERTPLTDLATVDRDEPRFSWSAPTLSLLSTPHGRTLAARAVRRLDRAAVERALSRAATALPGAGGEAGGSARAFVDELLAG